MFGNVDVIAIVRWVVIALVVGLLITGITALLSTAGGLFSDSVTAWQLSPEDAAPGYGTAAVVWAFDALELREELVSFTAGLGLCLLGWVTWKVLGWFL